MKKKLTTGVSKKTSISVPNYYLEIVKREIKSGRYTSASQVFMAGLRLLEVTEVKADKKRKSRIKS